MDGMVNTGVPCACQENSGVRPASAALRLAHSLGYLSPVWMRVCSISNPCCLAFCATPELHSAVSGLRGRWQVTSACPCRELVSWSHQYCDLTP